MVYLLLIINMLIKRRIKWQKKEIKEKKRKKQKIRDLKNLNLKKRISLLTKMPMRAVTLGKAS